MNIEKKKKIIIAITVIAIVLIGIILGVIIGKILNAKKEAKVTSSNTSNIENKETSQEDPLIIESSADPEDEQEEEQPEETEEPENETEEPKEEPQTSDIPYYIKVNNQANVVTIYKKDNEGNYTIPYKAMICSIGKATPESGVYKTYNKYTWRALVGGVYGQYATRIVGSILFHSVPYTSQNKGTLEYWEYDKLGTKASAGCVRLTVEDAKWIYDNCKLGTQVEFYSSEDPGPLGKPTAQKISEEEAVRGWDPTDPDLNNPWRTYKKEEQQTQEPVEDNNQEQENNQEVNNNQQTSQNSNSSGNTSSSGNTTSEEIIVAPNDTTEQVPSESTGNIVEDNTSSKNEETTGSQQSSINNSGSSKDEDTSTGTL